MHIGPSILKEEENLENLENRENVDKPTLPKMVHMPEEVLQNNFVSEQNENINHQNVQEPDNDEI